MGMFDTIHFNAPVPCPHCGEGILSVQTHLFDDCMADYHIGSLVPSTVHKGILKESLWCDACYHTKREPKEQIEVYLIIWHSVLAGVETSLDRAEQRLAAVDRLDLLAWLDEAQRDAASWRRRFHSLKSDVSRWHDHLAEAAKPDDGPSAATRLRKHRLTFFSLPEEVLSSPDPLGMILERHKPDQASGEEWP